MDFSKLTQNDKLAGIGSLAVIIGAIVAGYTAALGVLAILAALAMLVIIFLPRLSPQTKLPGSKGSLMLVAGGLAGVLLVLALLSVIGVGFGTFGLNDIFFLIAVVGGVVMAWAGWQEFQAEGGKFTIGTTSGGVSPPAERTDTPAEPGDEPVATTAGQEPAPERMPRETPRDEPSDEERRDPGV